MDKPVLHCNPNNPRPKVESSDWYLLDFRSIWVNLFRIIIGHLGARQVWRAELDIHLVQVKVVLIILIGQNNLKPETF